ncbi:LuxR C-terminal-related transcriptional regulator [Geodermatophilus ruber]|uniref:LuxR family transcriptional regulator, maltose regulon positive regulatory protein n=1 Tax=Geodermatophilus ruber TaxID=504800 RepID=A0A1I4KLM7_9ACTN|nr:LuxR C-terminal-related transcriptional regulator [Geodermatophilus ruber]SFL79672.1 LuxR family transcriptional regulator, maltose regulon positive regulatory protein [Geodermatophilus ruber]
MTPQHEHGHASGFAVSPMLLGKVSLPQLPRGVVDRPRLFRRLTEAARCSVTVVTGPTGCGKTQLLASWLRSSAAPGAPGWVTLDRTDRDPVRFWSALLAAARSAAAPPEGSLLSSLAPAPQSETPPDLLPALVAEAFAGLEPTTVLVLDDVHWLEGSPVASGLSYLMLHLPPSVRLVLSGLYLPELPTQRLRLEGRLEVVHAQDLAFTAEETAEMLRHSGITVSDEAARILRDRTEGWSAGLRLAALSLADGGSAEQTLVEFNGEHADVADYLVEEVFDRLPADTQDFLLRTSICDRLTGDLASALTGRANGRETLLGLARRNVFTTPTTSRQDWFRYHAMFADLLRSRFDRLGAPTRSHLHVTASRWFLDQGMPVDAFEHAVHAEDWDLAEEVLLSAWLSLYLDGQLVTLQDLIRRLPDHVVRCSGQIALVRIATGLALGDSGFVGTGDAALAGAGVDDSSETPNATAASVPAVSAPGDDGGTAGIPELVVGLERARLSGDLAAVTSAAGGLMHAAEHGAGSPRHANDLRALALQELGTTEYWAGRRAEAEDHLREALAAARANERGYVELGCLSQLIGVLTAQDRLGDALTASEEAVELARIRGWEQSGAAAELWHALGWIHYVRGELDDADQYLDLAEDAVRRQDAAVGAVILLVRGLVTGLRGRKREALATLEAAERTMQRLHVPYVFGGYITGERARLSLAIGQTAVTRRLLAGSPPDAYGSIHLALAHAELLLSDGRPDAAMDLLEKAVAVGEGFLDQRLQAGVLLSLLRAQHVGSVAAVQTMAEVVAMAEPEEMVQPFLQFGARVDRLLEALDRQRGPQRRFVQRLRKCLAGHVSPWVPLAEPGRGALPEPPTERELEVLRCLDSLLTLPEISSGLFVSVNTVKAHLRSLYRKLGVNGRREAVARARELGLV